MAAGSIVIAGGTDWEMKLHIFMSKGAKKDDEPSPFIDTFPTGHPAKKNYASRSLWEKSLLKKRFFFLKTFQCRASGPRFVFEYI